jgi:hypothetical protein
MASPGDALSAGAARGGLRAAASIALPAALVVLAAALRVPGLFTDFWFDEILGYALSQAARSPLEIVSSIHHSANHWLNALWMYAVGAGRPPWLYRLPSLAAGVAAVGVAGALARVLAGARDGRRAQWIATALAATNFCLVEYSSEARGYALLVLSSLCASWCLLLFEEHRQPRYQLGYWAWVAVALMSQLVAIQFLASCVLYSLCVRGRKGGATSAIAVTHGPPLAFLGLIIMVDVTYFQKIGSPPTTLSAVLGDLASFCLGVPNRGGWALAGGAVVALLLAATLWRGPRLQHPSRAHACWWLLPLLNVAVVPLSLVLALRLPFFYARYCIVGVALLQVALGVWLAALGREGGRRAALAAVLLAALIVANSWQWVRFQRQGRGHYRDAIEAMLAATSDETMTVASDDDFMTWSVLHYYGESVPGLRDRLVYVDAEANRKRPADWLILHSKEAATIPDADLRLQDGSGYVLHGVHDSSWVSGLRWFVYRRAGT